MDVLFLGVHVIMLIILIVLINGLVKRKLNAHYVKMFGIQLKQQNNERNDLMRYFDVIFICL
jgi:hypothetical protein